MNPTTPTTATQSTASHTPGPFNPTYEQLGMRDPSKPEGYSKGEWIVEKGDHSFEIVAGGTKTVCVLEIKHGYPKRIEEAAANARLIAAAPELLEALKNAANGFALLASNIRNHNQSAPKGGWLNVAADMANDMERHARAFINATTGGNQ